MAPLNVLDLLIVLAAVLAGVGGYRLGFVTRAAAWSGMCLGVLAAARLAPTFTSRFGSLDPNRTLLITAITLLSGAFLGQLAGQTLGHRLRTHPRMARRAEADRVAGAVLGVLLVGGAVWILTPAMASVPDWPARLATGSLLAREIDGLTPDPPDPLTAASRVLGERQWAALSEQLSGGMPSGPVPDLGDAPPEVDLAARRAVVRVTHDVCGRGQQVGTGFVAAAELVVTNAHVVAGTSDGPIEVEDGDGRTHQARLIVFEPDIDLAVLRVESLGVGPLALAERAEPSSTGWVYGHPGGYGLRIRAFQAGVESDARVPDIYGDRDLTRRIVPIRAQLAKGDSGSPLIDQHGEVVGVAFAISPVDDNLAVAIAMAEVRPLVDAALAAGPDAHQVGSGSCVAAD
jgi:S1-C subfamily serine protease